MDNLEIKNLTKVYNKKTVLNNISFKINKGERIGILGATGCGKTTLINMITRFYDTTEGSVIVDGNNFFHCIDIV